MFGKYIDNFINSLFSHETNNDLRSIMDINNNDTIYGGAMSNDIILKLSLNLNNFGILKINKIISGGNDNIFFSQNGPIEFNPTNSFDQPFGSLINPFIGSSVNFPPGIGTSILSPFNSYIRSDPIIIFGKPSFSSSFNGIRIADTLINIYNKIINDDRFNNSIGYLQVPSLAIEYTGEIQLIKLYLTRAKELADGKTKIETYNNSDLTIALLKTKAQKILNEKNILGANKFTKIHVDTLITSITNLQATINGLSRYNTINNYCINAVNQLQRMNGIFDAHNIGTTVQNSAAAAIIATPGTPLYIAVDAAINIRGAVPIPAVAPILPYISNPVNIGLINTDPLVNVIQTTIDAAYVIINNNVDGIFNDINSLT